MRLVPLRNTSTRPPDGDSGSEVPGGFSLRCAREYSSVGWKTPKAFPPMANAKPAWWMASAIHPKHWSIPHSVRHVLSLSGSVKCPFRRVSGIVAQRGEPHVCGERLKGPGTALVSRPSERRWSERTRSEAQGRMQGQDLLVPFGATAKRNPPSRAEPLHQQAATTSSG